MENGRAALGILFVIAFSIVPMVRLWRSGPGNWGKIVGWSLVMLVPIFGPWVYINYVDLMNEIHSPGPPRD